MTFSDFAKTAFNNLNTATSPGKTLTHLSDNIFRLEVKQAVSMASADKPVFGCHVTLSNALTLHDVKMVTPDDVLGWVDFNRLDHFIVRRLDKEEPVRERDIDSYFTADDGTLRCRQPMYIFPLADTSDDIKKHGWLLFKLI